MSEDRSSEFFTLAQGFGGSVAAAEAASAQEQTARERENLLNHYKQPNQNNQQSQQPTGRYGILADKATANPYSDLKDFHQTASSISLDISTTSSLLQELAHLVRHQSHNLFSTSGGGGGGGGQPQASQSQQAHMNQLVLDIKRHIESLNRRLEDAQQDLVQKKKRMSRNSQASQEASNLVSQLQFEFVRATQHFKDVLQLRSDGLKDVEDRKLAMLGAKQPKADPYGGAPTTPAPSTQSATFGHRPPVFGQSGGGAGSFGAGGGGKAFGGAGGGVNNRMQMLDLSSAYGKPPPGQGDDPSQIPAGESSSSLPRPYGVQQSSSDMYGTPAASGLRSRHNGGQADGGGGPGGMNTYSGSQSTYYPSTSSNSTNTYGHNTQSQQQQPSSMMTPVELMQMEQANGQAQQMQLIPDRNYVRDRADAMSTVETNIVELGTIFNKLAVMVNEHKDLVQRVEDNVEDANTHLELSMNTLTDTLDNLRSNQGVFFKVTGILVVFIILFITFFA
jgi:peptidoglycan hydrolase CwlO-like protein